MCEPLRYCLTPSEWLWTAECDVAGETRGSLKEWVLSQMFLGTLTIALSFPAPFLPKPSVAPRGGRHVMGAGAAAWGRRHVGGVNVPECPKRGGWKPPLNCRTTLEERNKILDLSQAQGGGLKEGKASF